MNDTVIKQMEKIVAEVMTSYQSDFENYDRRYIEMVLEFYRGISGVCLELKLCRW